MKREQGTKKVKETKKAMFCSVATHTDEGTFAVQTGSLLRTWIWKC
jgi:hypothetical protein